MPDASVIIPVKNSEATIRGTVLSLLRQEYDGNVEVILVGDFDDSSWEPIGDLLALAHVQKIEVAVSTPGRDANAKRNVGALAARGDVIVLTDSDMILPSDWLSKGLRLIDLGWDCVAGPMTSAADGYWAEYVDKNELGSKTPRMAGAESARPANGYVLTAENYGREGLKPPITANLFMTRELVETVGEFDQDFVYAYEDYEYLRRVADAGYAMLCTNELVAGHYHRQGFKALLKEYRGAGRGTGDYVIKYPYCPFARLRLRQLIACYVLAVVSGVSYALTPWSVVIAVVAAVMVSLLSAIKVRALVAATYPTVTLILGTAYVIGFTRRITEGWRLSHKTAIVATELPPPLARAATDELVADAA
ncbi:MAG: glycosyltransferase [Actinobacteria bacterium]|nr:glycosyltransferase [Actinomycetota bacterium]